MSDQSPEPWRIKWHGDWVEIVDACGENVYSGYLGDYVAESAVRVEKYFRRLVACVNACAGKTTEELESVAQGMARVELNRMPSARMAETALAAAIAALEKSHWELLQFAREVTLIYEGRTPMSLAGLYEIHYHAVDSHPDSVAAMVRRAEEQWSIVNAQARASLTGG